MQIRGKRIFNYRPMCLVAGSLALGIVLGEAVYGESIAFIIAMCCVAFLLTVAFVFVKKVRKFAYLPLALLIGLIGITASSAIYDANIMSGYSGEFTVKVASEIIIDGDSATFYASDIRIDGNKLKYDCFVNMPSTVEIDFNAGDTVKLTGRLVGKEHVRFYTYYASDRANGIGYYATASEVVKLSDGDAPFPLSLQLKIKRILYENTDEYTSSICQALILGDKSGMNGDLYDNISASGLAHVLAVSGLHITTLAAALYFLLRKFKVNPKIAFVIVTALTFFYSALCSFTASSLRAFIMCAVFSFASAFGRKRDNLSALSFAAILILLFRPTAIMEVGFLLSFFAVLGIFAFYGPFKRTGMKIVNKVSPKRRFGKRLAEVCAVSLSANLLTLPLVAYFFGRVPVLFILANFIVLPYMMAMYIALLALTLLSLITTFGGFVFIMRFLLIPFRVYVGLIGNLSFASVPVPSGVCAIVCFEIIALFASRYVFINRRAKAITVIVATAISVILCAVCALA